MTLDTIIMLTGAFVAVLPFLGLPNNVDSVLFLLAGILVIALGIVVRRKGLRLNLTRPPEPHAQFVDTEPQEAHETRSARTDENEARIQ